MQIPIPPPAAEISAAPPPLPAPVKNPSIWDELDENELKPAQEPRCPKCGAELPRQATVCAQCESKREARAMVARAAAPQRTAGGSRLGFLRRPARGNAMSLRVAIIMSVVGVGLFIFGFKEKRLADASTDAPEKISLKDLIQRGPEGNPNIILTDFQVCGNVVYRGRIINGVVSEPWTGVWVPVIVPGQSGVGAGAVAHPLGKDVQALIYSEHVSGQAALNRLAVQQLRGMITNRIASLGSKEQELLQRGYPGIQVYKCLIFHEGREPSSADRISFYLGGGGLLVLGGIGMLAWRYLGG